MKKMNMPMPTVTLTSNYFENNHKILIFYVLNQIPEIGIRKIIWDKIITYEEQEINRLINQS